MSTDSTQHAFSQDGERQYPKQLVHTVIIVVRCVDQPCVWGPGDLKSGGR